MLMHFGNTKLHFVGPAGSYHCRWFLFSLFCDNVQHHLEQDARHYDFRALRGAARVLGTSRQVLVSARELHSEVLSTWAALRDVPAHRLAVSIRTAALMENAWPLPDASCTVPALQAGWALPLRVSEVRTCAEVFDVLIKGLLRITESAIRPDVVRVWPDAASVEAETAHAGTTARG
jgi:hypothetical protein